MGDLSKRVLPHHHIATWAVSVLVIILAATVNTSSYIANTNDGPSAKTKKFFNYDESGENRSTPAICMEPSAEQKAAISQMESIQRELQALEQTDISGYTDEQRQIHEAKLTEYRNKLEELRVSSDLSRSGPSTECKAAIVAQMKVQMRSMHSQIDSKLFVTLKKVESKIVKVEASIAKVEVTELNTEYISAINSDIALIKLNLSTLNSFFTNMKTKMGTFLAAADSNPDSAFKSMESFGSNGDDAKAAKAADSMVAAFERIIQNVNKIIESQGDNG